MNESNRVRGENLHFRPAIRGRHQDLNLWRPRR
jgi:hypothetical protein